jgi:type I restriction enzyme M protein
MKDRVLRDFTAADIQRIADTFHAWQQGEGYADVPGYCYSATLADIRKHEHVLTPGRYVGAADLAEDEEPFAAKMARLTAELSVQFAESAKLEAEIQKNLAGLGYSLFPQERHHE